MLVGRSNNSNWGDPKVLYPKYYKHSNEACTLAIFWTDWNVRLRFKCNLSYRLRYRFSYIQSQNTLGFFQLRQFKPLLNHPQGCQGCKKNLKELRITTMNRFLCQFSAKIEENSKKPPKSTKNIEKLIFFSGFSIFLQIWLKTSAWL